jgi:hypothetical protein
MLATNHLLRFYQEELQPEIYDTFFGALSAAFKDPKLDDYFAWLYAAEQEINEEQATKDFNAIKDEDYIRKYVRQLYDKKVILFTYGCDGKLSHNESLEDGLRADTIIIAKLVTESKTFYMIGYRYGLNRTQRHANIYR